MMMMMVVIMINGRLKKLLLLCKESKGWKLYFGHGSEDDASLPKLSKKIQLILVLKVLLNSLFLN